MKKKVLICLLIVAVIVAAIVGVVLIRKSNSEKEDKKTETAKKLTEDDLLDMCEKKLYEGIEDMPMLENAAIDVKDSDSVRAYTGLDDGKDLENLVVSQPMIGSIPYTLVLATVKDGVDANKVAEKICDQVDMARWICVSAEELRTSNSDNLVFMVMGDKDIVDKVYKNFEKLDGKKGDCHMREAEEIEIPDDLILY